MSGMRAHEGVDKKRRWGSLKMVRKLMRRNESKVTVAAGTEMRVSIKETDAAMQLRRIGRLKIGKAEES